MARFIIGLILSVIAGAILLVLAAMADGMSHSMNVAQQTDERVERNQI